MTAAAGAHDQPLGYYGTSMFISFLVGLLSIAGLAPRESRHKSFVINLIGAIILAFTRIVHHGKRSASPALSALRTRRLTRP